jgi:hypothetical protein
MKYLFAWGLRVPGVLIVIWFFDEPPLSWPHSDRHRRRTIVGLTCPLSREKRANLTTAAPGRRDGLTARRS